MSSCEAVFDYRKNKPYKVIVCLVTLVAFFVNIFGYDLAQAAGTPSELTHVGPDRAGGPGLFNAINVENFSLPADLGTIKDSWTPVVRTKKGETQTTIMHIQDAHCNYPAQQKIAEIIRYLNEKYGVNVINLEGGSQDYNLSIFTGIADKKTREKVSDDFVREGLLSGPEYFAVNNPDKAVLWGVEEAPLYVENLKIYRDSLAHKEEVESQIKSLSNILSNLKRHIYSKDLLELDMNYNAYKAGNLDFKEYVTYLMASARAKGIDVKAHRNIYILHEVFTQETHVDFNTANKERDKLIDSLQKNLSKKEIEELVLKTLEFKADKIAHTAFYNYLITKSNSVNMDVDVFPELKKYIVYLSMYAAIDKTNIMPELDILEGELKGLLCENNTQETLVRLSKNLALLKNIFNISITKEDYSYYLKNRSEFNVISYMRFIDNNAPRYKITASLDKGIAPLDGYREEITRFYECSLKRDEAFMQNMKFSEIKPKTAILVTGGFHTDNLSALFRKNGISYVSILPNFKNDNGYECPYFRLLAGELTGIQKRIYSVLSTGPSASSLALAHIKSKLGPEVYTRLEASLYDLSVTLDEVATRAGCGIEEVEISLSPNGRKIIFTKGSLREDVSVIGAMFQARIAPLLEEGGPLPAKRAQNKFWRILKTPILGRGARIIIYGLIALNLAIWYLTGFRIEGIFDVSRVIEYANMSEKQTTLTVGGNGVTVLYGTALDNSKMMDYQLPQGMEELLSLFPQRHLKDMDSLGVVKKDSPILWSLLGRDYAGFYFHSNLILLGEYPKIVVLGDVSKEGLLEDLAHEVGHYIYNRIATKEARTKWKGYHKRTRKNNRLFISEEARKNEREDFAETYRAMMMGTYPDPGNDELQNEKLRFMLRYFMQQGEGRDSFTGARFYMQIPIDYDISDTLRYGVISLYMDFEEKGFEEAADLVVQRQAELKSLMKKYDDAMTGYARIRSFMRGYEDDREDLDAARRQVLDANDAFTGNESALKHLPQLVDSLKRMAEKARLFIDDAKKLEEIALEYDLEISISYEVWENNGVKKLTDDLAVVLARLNWEGGYSGFRLDIEYNGNALSVAITERTMGKIVQILKGVPGTQEFAEALENGFINVKEMLEITENAGGIGLYEIVGDPRLDLRTRVLEVPVRSIGEKLSRRTLEMKVAPLENNELNAVMDRIRPLRERILEGGNNTLKNIINWFWDEFDGEIMKIEDNKYPLEAINYQSLGVINRDGVERKRGSFIALKPYLLEDPFGLLHEVIELAIKSNIVSVNDVEAAIQRDPRAKVFYERHIKKPYRGDIRTHYLAVALSMSLFPEENEELTREIKDSIAGVKPPRLIERLKTGWRQNVWYFRKGVIIPVLVTIAFISLLVPFLFHDSIRGRWRSLNAIPETAANNIINIFGVKELPKETLFGGVIHQRVAIAGCPVEIIKVSREAVGGLDVSVFDVKRDGNVFSEMSKSNSPGVAINLGMWKHTVRGKRPTGWVVRNGDTVAPENPLGGTALFIRRSDGTFDIISANGENRRKIRGEIARGRVIDVVQMGPLLKEDGKLTKRTDPDSDGIVEYDYAGSKLIIGVDRRGNLVVMFAKGDPPLSELFSYGEDLLELMSATIGDNGHSGALYAKSATGGRFIEDRSIFRPSDGLRVAPKATNPFRFPDFIWGEFKTLLQTDPEVRNIRIGEQTVYEIVRDNGLAWTYGEEPVHFIDEKLNNAMAERVWDIAKRAVEKAIGHKVKMPVKDVIVYHESLHAKFRGQKYKELIYYFKIKTGITSIGHPFIQAFREKYGEPHGEEALQGEDALDWYIEEFIVLSMQEEKLFNAPDAVITRMNLSEGVDEIKIALREAVQGIEEAQPSGKEQSFLARVMRFITGIFILIKNIISRSDSRNMPDDIQKEEPPYSPEKLAPSIPQPSEMRGMLMEKIRRGSLAGLISDEIVRLNPGWRLLVGGHAFVFINPSQPGVFYKVSRVLKGAKLLESDYDPIMHEAEVLKKLEDRGVRSGIAKVISTGVNPDGGIWVKYAGIAEAENLHSVLWKSFTPVEKLDVFVKAARILKQVHDADLVHNDIKPENILVNRKKEVMIIDFGIAARQGEMPPSAGTRAIEPPEDVRRRDSDVFSLGMALKQSCTMLEGGIDGKEALDSGLVVLIKQMTDQSRVERNPKEMDGVTERLETIRLYFEEKPGIAPMHVGESTIFPQYHPGSIIKGTYVYDPLDFERRGTHAYLTDAIKFATEVQNCFDYLDRGPIRKLFISALENASNYTHKDWSVITDIEAEVTGDEIVIRVASDASNGWALPDSVGGVVFDSSSSPNKMLELKFEPIKAVNALKHIYREGITTDKKPSVSWSEVKQPAGGNKMLFELKIPILTSAELEPYDASVMTPREQGVLHQNPFRFPDFIWSKFKTLVKADPALGDDVYDIIKTNGLAWTRGEEPPHFIDEKLDAKTAERVWDIAKKAVEEAIGHEVKMPVRDVIVYHESLHTKFRDQRYKGLINHFKTKNRITSLDHPFIQTFQMKYGSPHGEEAPSTDQGILDWYIEEFMVICMQEDALFNDPYAVIKREFPKGDEILGSIISDMLKELGALMVKDAFLKVQANVRQINVEADKKKANEKLLLLAKQISEIRKTMSKNVAAAYIAKILRSININNTEGRVYLLDSLKLDKPLAEAVGRNILSDGNRNAVGVIKHAVRHIPTALQDIAIMSLDKSPLDIPDIDNLATKWDYVDMCITRRVVSLKEARILFDGVFKEMFRLLAGMRREEEMKENQGAMEKINDLERKIKDDFIPLTEVFMEEVHSIDEIRERIHAVLNKNGIVETEKIKEAAKIVPLPKGVSLRFEETGLFRFNGNETAFAIILNNLVTNAVQAIERKRKATGIAKEEEIVVAMKKSDDDTVEITVMDTGTGIAPEKMAHLFDDLSGTTREDGMGIGLPLIKAIVEHHGGTIEGGDREDGKRGAEFTIALPAPQAPIPKTALWQQLLALFSMTDMYTLRTYIQKFAKDIGFLKREDEPIEIAEINKESQGRVLRVTLKTESGSTINIYAKSLKNREEMTGSPREAVVVDPRLGEEAGPELIQLLGIGGYKIQRVEIDNMLRGVLTESAGATLLNLGASIQEGSGQEAAYLFKTIQGLLNKEDTSTQMRKALKRLTLEISYQLGILLASYYVMGYAEGNAGNVCLKFRSGLKEVNLEELEQAIRNGNDGYISNIEVSATTIDFDQFLFERVGGSGRILNEGKLIEGMRRGVYEDIYQLFFKPFENDTSYRQKLRAGFVYFFVSLDKPTPVAIESLFKKHKAYFFDYDPVVDSSETIITAVRTINDRMNINRSKVSEIFRDITVGRGEGRFVDLNEPVLEIDRPERPPRGDSRSDTGEANFVFTEPLRSAMENGNILPVLYKDGNANFDNNFVLDGATKPFSIKPEYGAYSLTILRKAIGDLSQEDRGLLDGFEIIFYIGKTGAHYSLPRKDNDRKQIFINMYDIANRRKLVRELHHEIQERQYIITEMDSLLYGYWRDFRGLDIIENRISNLAGRVHRQLHEEEKLVRDLYDGKTNDIVHRLNEVSARGGIGPRGLILLLSRIYKMDCVRTVIDNDILPLVAEDTRNTIKGVPVTPAMTMPAGDVRDTTAKGWEGLGMTKVQVAQAIASEYMRQYLRNTIKRHRDMTGSLSPADYARLDDMMSWLVEGWLKQVVPETFWEEQKKLSTEDVAALMVRNVFAEINKGNNMPDIHRLNPLERLLGERLKSGEAQYPIQLRMLVNTSASFRLEEAGINIPEMERRALTATIASNSMRKYLRDVLGSNKDIKADGYEWLDNVMSWLVEGWLAQDAPASFWQDNANSSPEHIAATVIIEIFSELKKGSASGISISNKLEPVRRLMASRLEGQEMRNSVQLAALVDASVNFSSRHVGIVMDMSGEAAAFRLESVGSATADMVRAQPAEDWETATIKFFSGIREFGKPVRVVMGRLVSKTASADDISRQEESLKLAARLNNMLDRNGFKGSQVILFDVDPGDLEATRASYEKAYGRAIDGLPDDGHIFSYVPRPIREEADKLMAGREKAVHVINDTIEGNHPDILLRLGVAHHLAYYFRAVTPEDRKARKDYATEHVTAILKQRAVSIDDVEMLKKDLDNIFSLDFILKIKPVDFETFRRYQDSNIKVLRSV